MAGFVEVVDAYRSSMTQEISGMAFRRRRTHLFATGRKGKIPKYRGSCRWKSCCRCGPGASAWPGYTPTPFKRFRAASESRSLLDRAASHLVDALAGRRALPHGKC
jgi:hypothetical protein